MNNKTTFCTVALRGRPDRDGRRSEFSISRGNESPELRNYALSAYERIHRMSAMPEKSPVLFGDRKSPYMRIDPYYMDPLEIDPEAQEALNIFTRSMEAALQDLVLEPSDYVFINNYRTVHGRKPFKARYDGNDRWLKRMNITRDLRKSRDARISCTGRFIY